MRKSRKKLNRTFGESVFTLPVTSVASSKTRPGTLMISETPEARLNVAFAWLFRKVVTSVGVRVRS